MLSQVCQAASVFVTVVYMYIVVVIMKYAGNVCITWCRI